MRSIGQTFSPLVLSRGLSLSKAPYRRIATILRYAISTGSMATQDERMGLEQVHV